MGETIRYRCRTCEVDRPGFIGVGMGAVGARRGTL